MAAAALDNANPTVLSAAELPTRQQRLTHRRGPESKFNDMINVPFSSEAFVAGMLALFLDVTLPKKDSQTRKDRGMHWWDTFRSFKTDTRSEEFYSLPFNLNKFFPSV